MTRPGRVGGAGLDDSGLTELSCALRTVSATVESEVTYAAETASYVRAGVDKQQASVGFPFAAVSFEREHKERQAGASYKKQLQCIGRWYYPRVRLRLAILRAASDRFKAAIKTPSKL